MDPSGIWHNVLAGDVWIDETYISVDKADRAAKSGKGLRGISQNKIAIATANGGKALVVVL